MSLECSESCIQTLAPKKTNRKKRKEEKEMSRGKKVRKSNRWGEFDQSTDTQYGNNTTKHLCMINIH
jgi:hypothetical protein